MRTNKIGTKEKKSFLSLKPFDQLGDEFNLKFRDKDQLQSNTGGCLSLIGLLFMLTALWVTANNYISTDSPDISSYTQFTPNYPKFDLYKNSLFLDFTLADTKKNGLIKVENLDRFITVRGSIMTIKNVENNFEQIKQEISLTFNYIPCKDVKNPKILETITSHNETKNILFSSAICPNITENDKDKYFIQGKPASLPMTVLVISVDPCSLEDKTKCASKEELKIIQFGISETDQSLDMTNMENPVTPIIKNDKRFNFALGKRTVLKYWFKKNEIWDETQDLIDAELRAEYVDFESVDKDLDERDQTNFYCEPGSQQLCDSYLTVEFYVTGKKKVYKRKYETLLQSLADLGGFKEVVFIFLGLIYWVCTGNNLLKFMKKKLYGFSGKEEKKVRYILLKDEENDSDDGDKLFDEVVENTLDVNFDGVELFSKMNQMSVLNEIFFEEHDRRLLPLAILNISKKNLEDEKRKKRKQEDDLPKGNMSIEEAYARLRNHQPMNEINKGVRNFLLKNLPEISEENQNDRTELDCLAMTQQINNGANQERDQNTFFREFKRKV